MKSTHPLFFLVMGIIAVIFTLGIMKGIYFDTQKVSQASSRDQGRSYFEPEELSPFKSVEKKVPELEKLSEAMAILLDKTELASREDLSEYIEMRSIWEEVFVQSWSYRGILLPLYPKSVDFTKAEEKRLTIELEGGEKMTIFVSKEVSAEGNGPFYLEVFYLGQVSEGENLIQLGVARELHELGRGGEWPMLPSDDLALDEVIDSYQMKREAQIVPVKTMYHLFGKNQKEEETPAPLKNVGYKELMSHPARYRGEVVSFIGTLIHLERRRFSDGGLGPGRELYYEGFLLNSDRLQFIFRTPMLPAGIKDHSLVHLKGYFVQRYNIRNRLGGSTWVPMVIASDLSVIVERGYTMTLEENLYLFAGMMLIISVVSIFIYRSGRENKRMREERREHRQAKMVGKKMFFKESSEEKKMKWKTPSLPEKDKKNLL